MEEITLITSTLTFSAALSTFTQSQSIQLLFAWVHLLN